MDVSQLRKNQQKNCLYGRCPKITCNGKISTFEQLLEKVVLSLSIQELRFLAVEMIKRLTLKNFSDLYSLKEQGNYSLKHKSFFKIPRKKTLRMASKASRISNQKFRKYSDRIYLKSKLIYGCP